MSVLVGFRSFHRDTGGQISFLMVVGAVVLTILLGWLGNTGYQVAGKVEAQAAADAAALSGGVWIARGLNLTSAINVIQSQLVAGAILLNSLDQALRLSIPAVAAQCGRYLSCTPWNPIFCGLAAAVTCTQSSLLPVISTGVRLVVIALSRCPWGVFWVVAKGIEYLNAAIHYTFFGIAFVEAYRMASANDASTALLLPGPLFDGEFGAHLLTLPTEKHEFPALCDPMERGSPVPPKAEQPRERGYAPLLHYAPGQGPLLLGECRVSNVLTVLTGIPPVGPIVLPLIVEGWKAKLCEGDSPDPLKYDEPESAASLEDCVRKNGKAKWVKLKIVTKRLDQPLENPRQWLHTRVSGSGLDIEDIEAEDFSVDAVKGKDPYSRLENDPDIASVWEVTDSQIERSCDEFPRRRDDRREAERSGMYIQSIIRDPSEEELAEPPYRYSFWIWVLLQTEVEKENNENEEEKEFAENCDTKQFKPGPECDAVKGRCKNVLPNPYLLRDGSPLPYLVLATRENRRIWFTEKWRETPPTFVTYAQVEVYNGVGLSGEGDAFTQDWRVRLQRATLLDSIWERAGLDRSSAALDEALGELLELLEELPIHDGRLERALEIAKMAFGTGSAETASYLPEDGPVEGETPAGEPAWRAILNH